MYFIYQEQLDASDTDGQELKNEWLHCLLVLVSCHYVTNYHKLLKQQASQVALW